MCKYSINDFLSDIIFYFLCLNLLAQITYFYLFFFFFFNYIDIACIMQMLLFA